MRLGIDYRLLASRENIVNRGIGRYTQQQLRHVLELDTEHEYLLLCPPRPDLSLVLPEILAAPNVSVCEGPASEGDPLDRRGLLRRAAVYQDWVHGLGVDLYHATAPFWLEQTAPPAFDACPMVATVYDFIPLIFPSAYLADPRRAATYAGRAQLVRSATRLLAISEGTRDDAVHYLGFPREAIDCAWPFADPCFRPLCEEEVAAGLRPLAARVPLPGRFVLTVAALHHSKNLELVLGAYGRLSATFRRSLPLVLACHLDDWAMNHVRQWAGTFGVADDIVLTGFVSDDELAALYNAATLVVHPSRYEGFGLPVVEAMQCGAAVVTTTAPSLPEVAGGAAVLVEPEDPIALAVAIEGLSRDESRRREMGAMGLARAATFTPEALARNTLESYRRAVAEEPVPVPVGRRRIAVRAATPPTIGRTSSGDDVEVFTDDGDGPLPDELLDRCPVHHVSAFERCHQRRPFDAVLDDPGGLDEPSHRTLESNRLYERQDLDVLGWATALSVQVAGGLGRGANVLCLGPHSIDAAFDLTRSVGEVTVAGPWLDEAAGPRSRALIVDPSLATTVPFERDRLVVRCADPARLPLRDASFDAVVSCTALETVSCDEAVAALAEAARVVRPGSVVAVAITVRLHGPAGSPGLPLDWVLGELVPACGLEPVGEVRTAVSDVTLTGRRPLSLASAPVLVHERRRPLTVWQGAVLGALHLTLRR